MNENKPRKPITSKKLDISDSNNEPTDNHPHLTATQRDILFQISHNNVVDPLSAWGPKPRSTTRPKVYRCEI